MYLSYEAYSLAMGDAMSEAEYDRLAPIADAVIDDWTLGRVGRAISKGEGLPSIVQTLYFTIVSELPNAFALEGSGARVASFSNGIDSYTFDLTETVATRLKGSCGWLLEYLPIEWISAVASFEGGNRYAG